MLSGILLKPSVLVLVAGDQHMRIDGDSIRLGRGKNAAQGVLSDIVAANLVDAQHTIRCGRRALLNVAEHLEARLADARATLEEESLNSRWVAMEGDNTIDRNSQSSPVNILEAHLHWLVASENAVEGVLAESVGVRTRGGEDQQVNDIDNADA